MLIKDLKDCPETIAGDLSTLREILHPEKGPFAVGYSLARAVVKPGAATKPHRLRSSEVYFLLAGRGRMHIGQETEDVTEGQAVYIPPGSTQFIENTGGVDLAFLCIVDPAWRPEDEEVIEE